MVPSWRATALQSMMILMSLGLFGCSNNRFSGSSLVRSPDSPGSTPQVEERQSASQTACAGNALLLDECTPPAQSPAAVVGETDLSHSDEVGETDLSHRLGVGETESFATNLDCTVLQSTGSWGQAASINFENGIAQCSGLEDGPRYVFCRVYEGFLDPCEAFSKGVTLSMISDSTRATIATTLELLTPANSASIENNHALCIRIAREANIAEGSTSYGCFRVQR